MWFDHHTSEADRVGWSLSVKGESRLAPSAASIIYDYYGGSTRFTNLEDMILSVNKVDSGNLTKEEILNPTGWILLGFLSDPRTGLGRFRDFSISNYQLMEKFINYCRSMPIVDILALPDVVERIELYKEQTELFKTMLMKYTKADENVIITDLRNVDEIYTGNRFLIYSLFPKQNVSIWIVDGKQKQNVSIACGYSILNRTAKTDVGALMLKYNGGGHRMVGTCQVPYNDANSAIEAIVTKLKSDAE